MHKWKYLCGCFLKKSKFEVRPLYEKDGKKEKSNKGLLVSFRMFQKFIKDGCMIKFILILVKYIQCLNSVFVKVLAHGISF